MSTATQTKTGAKTNRKEAAAQQREQLKQAADAVAERVATEPEFAADFEAFAARFPTYSERNHALIYAQNPEATLCAGFRKWQAEGRQVRKGSHGIKILAPTKWSKKDAEEKPEKSTPEKEDDEDRMRFIFVTVFDISQTDPIEQAQ